MVPPTQKEIKKLKKEDDELVKYLQKNLSVKDFVKVLRLCEVEYLLAVESDK